MANFTVVYDACIFYPAPLRDLLIRLARTRRFRARWTRQIHEEWTRNLLADRKDLTKQQLDWTVSQINGAVPDCLITGFEHIVNGLQLPDPNDRHVLAAAIRAGAAAIVTMNLRDFPDEILSEFEIFARHPDDFILDLADLEPQILERVAKEQRADLRNPPLSAEEFVANIRRQRLPGVADFLEERIDLI
ncbi:MAG: PIN domain-containing protein [Pseudomonadota bacterium]|nr:PIN domain-containing protein [Pseudomonadota bacterium]